MKTFILCYKTDDKCKYSKNFIINANSLEECLIKFEDWCYEKDEELFKWNKSRNESWLRYSENSFDEWYNIENNRIYYKFYDYISKDYSNIEIYDSNTIIEY
jgi:hypothetical protein